MELNTLKLKSKKTVGFERVYDLSIEDNHNFFANSVLVHNCFQEQIMKIAELVGGHTRGETNKLRKLLVKYGKFSKGNPEYEKNIGKYHKKFIETALLPENLGSEKAAEEMWDTMASFAAYGFNKSHSVSYSKVSAIEYWLKHYYPAEFNVALLNNTDVKKEKKGESVMAKYITAITRRGMKVKKPSINLSNLKFSLSSDNEIVWGLSAIKGITSLTIDKIIEERNKSKFESMEDLIDRVGRKYINKRVIEALVWSGALDDFFSDEIRTRFDLHEYYFKVIKGDKIYEDPDDDHSVKFLIKKEIELCKFSILEMNQFNKIRKKHSDTSDTKLEFLYEIEDVGSHMCIAKIEKKEYRMSKKKTKFVSFTLRDDTAICSGLSYFYPWGQDPSKPGFTDLTEDLVVGEWYLFQIEKNEKGFKNVKSFSKV